MAFLHYFTKVLIKILLHIFWIFPIRKKRITLLNRLSFTYGDNLKYICEFIHSHYAQMYQIVFPVKTGEQVPYADILTCKPFSFKYFRYLLSSSVIITNSVGVAYLPIRKGQIVINTWHGGGPYKKTGLAVYNNFWMRLENKMNDSVTAYMLSSCEYFTKYEAPALGIKADKCVPSGMPRNDVFFQTNLNLRHKVCSLLNLTDSEKIVLYAPTYRGSEWCGKKNVFKSDVDYERLLRVLERTFGQKWRFALRLHPGLKDVQIEDSSILNVTSYPDMQELLYAADAVITDYSSLMWDFSLTGRPCFLYAPDIDEYEHTRGFYMPSSQWPYPIAHNNDELERNIAEFDLADYQKAVKQHHVDCGSYEQGNACETIMKLIENHIEKE